MDTEGEYQKTEDEAPEAAQIEINAEEGGFMAVAADPEKQKELQNAPKLDLGELIAKRTNLTQFPSIEIDQKMSRFIYYLASNFR